MLHRDRRAGRCAALLAPTGPGPWRRSRPRPPVPDGRRAGASWARRRRSLPGRSLRHGEHAALDHRSARAATSRSGTRTAACGSCRTARSTTTSKLMAGAGGRSGTRFATRSDTEVMVHAFEEWGSGVPRSPERRVRLRRLGPPAPRAVPRARPLRDPPDVPGPLTAATCFRLRGQGAAAPPRCRAAHRPVQRRGDLHAVGGAARPQRVPGHLRAAAGPLRAHHPRRHGPARALVGPHLRPEGGRGVPCRGGVEELARRTARAPRPGHPHPAPRRRARRRVPERRARLVDDRRARATRTRRAA